MCDVSAEQSPRLKSRRFTEGYTEWVFDDAGGIKSMVSYGSKRGTDEVAEIWRIELKRADDAQSSK